MDLKIRAHKEDGQIDVGYWENRDDHGKPSEQPYWHSMRECKNWQEAWAFVNYLNGGTGKTFV